VPSPWARDPDPAARLRIVCLPYAGGGTVEFRQWQPRVPAGVQVVPVVLPGRETRLGEPPIAEMGVLVRALADALPPWLDRPWALFGFSMGSWVGFELVRELRRRALPLPTRLIACARRAPHLPDALPPLHPLPDDAFLAGLQARYNAIPAQILANRELLDVFVPALRADFTLLERYAPSPDAPLPLPIDAWGGEADRTLLPGSLAAWGAHSTTGARVRMFPGGHFFLRESRDAVLTAILGAVGSTP
jgi:medium-chain acyl-[acyl-carrier-protein] hydrolase